MPYKSKRTRDLQGEVVAGSGLSVTEQTKPDGTKEYTINNIAPGITLTVDGAGLSLIANVLKNTMAARMGWSDANGSIDYRDDNNEPVLQIDPLDKIFLGDANLGASFFLKQLALGANKLISGDVQIAENESSTEGVSLQTLADMSNSAATYELDFENSVQNDTAYIFTDDFSTKIESIGDYYTPISTSYLIDNTPVGGLKVLTSGVYKINVEFQTYISSATTPIDSSLIIDILIVDDNGNFDAIETTEKAFYPAPDVSSEKYIGEIALNTLIEVSSNKSICIVATISNTNNTEVGLLGMTPIFSIQKVR